MSAFERYARNLPRIKAMVCGRCYWAINRERIDLWCKRNLREVSPDRDACTDFNWNHKTCHSCSHEIVPADGTFPLRCMADRFMSDDRTARTHCDMWLSANGRSRVL